MAGIERQVPILGVAPVADRNRTDSPGDDPVDHDRRQEDRREPDPSELPSRVERQPEGNCHQEAAETLIEILLDEEGAVAAEDASLDRRDRRRAFGPDRVGRRTPPARELSSLRTAVLPRLETVRAVAAGTHAG